MSKLVIISNGLAGRSLELGERWVTIGRGDGNAFQILDRSVSNQHCEVLLRGNELVVRDLGSTNGTFIGDKTISEGILQPGQTLHLGLVELRLELSERVPAAPPATASAPAAAAPPVPAKQSGPVPGRKTYRVLFVDDSLAFLQMINDLFDAQPDKDWEIHTAPTAEKALAILQQKLIHLVVLDVGMPLLDGIQLLGIIHQRYPNIKKVILTAQGSEGRRDACLANGAELFLLKPGDEDGWRLVFNMLTNVLRWSDGNDFISTLGETGLFDVIQLECLGRNSLVLEVRNPQTAGEIYIESGAIVHASAGKLVGDKAFSQLLSLTDGEFRLIPFRAPPERSVQRQWEWLLAEATRAQPKDNAPAADHDTFLVTKKTTTRTSAPTAPPLPAAVVPQPPKSTPAGPLGPEIRRRTTGMDFITLEEMLEADTGLVPDKNGRAQPFGSPKK